MVLEQIKAEQLFHAGKCWIADSIYKCEPWCHWLTGLRLRHVTSWGRHSANEYIYCSILLTLLSQWTGNRSDWCLHWYLHVYGTPSPFASWCNSSGDRFPVYKIDGHPIYKYKGARLLDPMMALKKFGMKLVIRSQTSTVVPHFNYC